MAAFKIFSSVFLSSFLLNQAHANVVGADTQNFNPTSNGIDFVTVQSARTLDPGVLNFGLFFNYAVNTLSFLDKADPVALQNRTKFNDRLLSSDLSFGLGLMKNFDIGLSLPFLLKQDIDNDNRVAYFAATGNTEQRANAKYTFSDSGAWANALVATVNRNAIENNPYTGINPGLTYGLEYATSWKWSDSWLGFNFGHRWKNPGTSLASRFGISPLPNIYTYSAAWSRVLPNIDTKVILEIFGSTPANNAHDINLSNRDLSNLEALAGLKQSWGENIAGQFGIGAEVNQGFATPDWRAYVGINWTMGPLWRKSVVAETKKQLEETPAPTTQRFVLSNLRFEVDSDALAGESLREVEQVCEMIASTQNDKRVLVEGHTDSSGDDSYNLQLSRRRALTVKSLIATKVPLDVTLVESVGFGETIPIADNDNYQGRAENRRVVVIVYSQKINPDGKESVIEIRLTK